MGINLMADLGFDENAGDVKNAREAASIYATVIDELVACRKALHLSQKKVAKRMETSQSTVSEFESVSSDARFSTLIRYAQAVECEMVIELEPRGTHKAPVSTVGWVAVNMTERANVIPFAPARFTQPHERPGYVPTWPLTAEALA